MKVKESYEDYLKAIYLIAKKNKGGWVSNSEIAEFLDVRPSSVTNMLYKLREENYIKWSPRKSLRLTEPGKKIAKTLEVKYRHLQDFFQKVLKIDDPELLKKLSCGIEHHITLEISEALENLVIEYR